MEIELLKTLGQLAGIGGISLGVLLLVFRQVIAKSIFRTLTTEYSYRLLRLMIVLTWSIAALGIAAWVLSLSPNRNPTLGATVEACTAIKGYPTGTWKVLVACRRVTITRLLASNVSWPLAVKSCSRSNSIPT